MDSSSHSVKLSHNANQILYVRNLPFTIDETELFDLFGRYGPIRQIRLGNIPATRTTAYVVYESVSDAQKAKESLNGFGMGKRFLIVQYHNPDLVKK